VAAARPDKALDKAMPLFVAVLRRSPGGLGVKVARTMASDLFMRDASSKCLSTYLGLWPRHLTQYLCFGTSSLAQRRRLSLVTAPVSPAAESEGEMNPYGFASPGGGRAAQVIAAPEEAELSAAAAKPAAPKKVSLHALRQKYLRREPLSMITAYDYPSARVADGAGADMLLVGDSLGMVVLGQEDTTEVTVSQMVHHCQAAARGTQRAFLVADLPFGSYLTPDQAASNGVRLIKEGRADAVKLEGGVNVVRQVRSIKAQEYLGLRVGGVEMSRVRRRATRA
jgi:3-methyl-2-oxobutanoate hydroxymethyltransferase